MTKISRRKLLKLAAPAIIIPATLSDVRDVSAQLFSVAPDNALYDKPFTAQSLWNARPQNVVFGSGQIQPANNFPGVSDGGVSGSTGLQTILQDGCPVFYAHPTDGPMNVAVTTIQDEIGNSRTVTVPHWPSVIYEVPGDPNTSDKEIILYDTATKLRHCFWSLRGSGSSWNAQEYAVETAIANNPAWFGGASQGLGFGIPSRPDNVRAAGVSPASGMLRLWELYAGTYPKHALAFAVDWSTITLNTATSGPPPQFPATGQDAGFNYSGTGTNSWPMGQFFMLPPTFNVNSLQEQGTKLIAQTLMNYGVYMVDVAPSGMIFVAELAAPPTQQSFFSSGPIYPGGPSSAVAFWTNEWSGVSARFNADGTYFAPTDFNIIRDALRPVASVGSWLDANGNTFTPMKWRDMNILSMRNPWATVSGSPPAAAGYYTEKYAYYCPNGSPAFSVQTQRYSPASPHSGNGPWFDWHDVQGFFHTSYTLNEADPIVNRSYTLTAYGTGNLTSQIIIQNQTNSVTYFSSNVLSPGQSQVFTWPNQASTATVIQVNNPANGGGSIRLELVGN